jgi:protein-tyrosine phosphatase
VNAAVRPFRVTTVCTGNICRSPFAEAALGRLLQGPREFHIDSRGSAAGFGRAVPGPMLEAAARHDIDLRPHRSRALDREVVDGADLVLALGRDHRAAVARLSPRASRRTFTLLEFGRLLGTLDARDMHRLRSRDLDAEGRLAEAVRLVASRRGHLVTHAAAADLSIADPFGGRDSAYADAADRIMTAVRPVAAFLAEVAAPPL